MKWNLIALVVMLIHSFAGAQTRIQDYEYNPTAILALSLARSGNIIPESDMPEVINSLDQYGKVPRRFQAQFESLLATAQMILEIKAANHYFPVGFEFESGHHTKDSLDEFKAGANAILHNVRETFGATAPKYSKIKKEGDDMAKAAVKDDSGAEWSVVQEYVRDDARSTTPTGWETVSPPIFNRDYLRNMAGFVLRLGQNPYGREAEFTGAHQTSDLLPQGAEKNETVLGLTAANYTLMKQQFSPAIFQTLQVERYGGHKNFFIRPLVLDHGDLLREISATDPQQMKLSHLRTLMEQKYALAEFEAHLKHSAVFTEEDRVEMRRWSDAQKMAYPKLWKYHDQRIHFHKENPFRTLIEDRTGDYRQASPQDILRVTYFNQLLLSRSYEMAKRGELFQLNIPARTAQETDDAYWKRLSDNAASSQQALFEAMKLDETARQLLRGDSFKPRGPKFKVLPRESYGYEKEFIGHEIVDLVVPKDPEARAQWRSWSHKKKVQYFVSLIADGDEVERFLDEERIRYTQDTRRIITVEFEADTMKFPFLDPDLFLEDSGNFEIKSNGRDIFDPGTLKQKIQQTDAVLEEAGYGMHAHLFIPKERLKEFRDSAELTAKLLSTLERLSLMMQVEDYRDASPTEADHHLDSWSLDRFSPRDLKQIGDWLQGRGPLGNLAQKYHNLGIREVEGGLDVEIRAAGNDIAYMDSIMEVLVNSFIKKEFVIQQKFGEVKPLFHDFTHVANAAEALPNTLYYALAQRYNLTEQQRQIVYKLQFEIYKPVMPEYVFFKDFYSWNSVAPEDMDARYVRTNYESNVILPLLNYEEQPGFQQNALIKVVQEREAFLKRIYDIVLSVEKTASYQFILQNKDFMYLANWMERSKHPTKPDLNKVDQKTADQQRKALDKLVRRVRGEVVKFTQNTEIPTMVRNTFTTWGAQTNIVAKVELPKVSKPKSAAAGGKAGLTQQATANAQNATGTLGGVKVLPRCQSVWMLPVAK